MTSTSPDALRAWFRLMRLEARMRAAIGERLREVDLSVPQCDVLTTLGEQEGVSQQELAERLYVTKGNISGLIDRLAAAGLVERRAPPNDRRSHAIYLTEAGRRAAKRGVEIQVAFVEETLGRLAPADLAAFYSAMGKTRDLTRQAQEKLATTPSQPATRKRATKAGKAETSPRT